MAQTNSLAKLISLSVLIAIGFLNIVLSCALYENYLPLIDVAIFLIAPLPNAIASWASSAYEGNFLGDYDEAAEPPITEFCHFLTGFLVTSGTCLPVVLYHCHSITGKSFALSLSGGFIIYLSMVLFSVSFKDDENDGYDF